MIQPTDVLVTGFVKSPFLLERSLAPLRRLKHEGIVRNIHCVTWASPEIDPYVAPLEAIPEVQLTRVPQPEVEGSPNQRGVVYQIRNLEAALDLGSSDNGLVLKWRLDFVAKHAFIRDKIVNFERYCAVPQNACFGVAMPAPVLARKFWIPWADSNQPFFMEDAVFLGRREDVARMVTSLTDEDVKILGDARCGSYAHVVRYARMFLQRYPLFENYLRNFHYFRHDIAYRDRLIPHLVNDGYFWHLLIAHAWILHSQFHVDIGAPGDLAFYANAVNRDTDWANPKAPRVASPYDGVTEWREGTKPGQAFPSVCRAFGRLMDDGWHKAFFTQELPDFPATTLIGLMENVARSGDGRLGEIEREFYRSLDGLHREASDARKRA